MSKITKKELKKELDSFVMIINELPTKGNTRYDIEISEDKKIGLVLNHCSDNYSDVIIESSEIDVFRSQLFKLYKSKRKGK